MHLTINGTPHTVDVPEEMPLLWVLRDRLNLTGTKYGCGIGACSACTVHVDGAPTRSCMTPMSAVADKAITTIEGIGPDSPLQQAWLAHQVPQCGYCQPGWLMSATALLAHNPSPTDAQIDAALQGHICRCGTYNRIRAAIRSVAEGTP
ncbi:MAG: isoquinoline 1-oxidoreductase alpha subunit [Myxococcota bacterium]